MPRSFATGKSVRVQDLERNEDRHGNADGRRKPITMDDQYTTFEDHAAEEEVEVNPPSDEGDPKDLTKIFPA